MRNGKRSEFDGQALRAEIAQRAYLLFLERGGGHGNDIEDWLRAERLVLEQIAAERGFERVPARRRG
jgi:hypothetical protein